MLPVVHFSLACFVALVSLALTCHRGVSAMEPFVCSSQTLGVSMVVTNVSSVTLTDCVVPPGVAVTFANATGAVGITDTAVEGALLIKGAVGGCASFSIADTSVGSRGVVAAEDGAYTCFTDSRARLLMVARRIRLADGATWRIARNSLRATASATAWTRCSARGACVGWRKQRGASLSQV